MPRFGGPFSGPRFAPPPFHFNKRAGCFLGVRFWAQNGFFLIFWGPNFLEKRATTSQVSGPKGPVYPWTARNRKGSSPGPAVASPCVSHTLLLEKHRVRGSRDSQGSTDASVGALVQLLLSHFQLRTGSTLIRGSLQPRRSACLLCSEETPPSFLTGASLHLSFDRRRFAGRPYESLFST